MPSIGHMIILLVIIVLVFGTGKLTKAMGDIGRGVKEFKKGVGDEESKQAATAASATTSAAPAPPTEAVVQIAAPAAPTVAAAAAPAAEPAKATSSAVKSA